MGAWKDFWLGVEQPVEKQELRVDEEGNPSPLILPPSRTDFVNVPPREAIRIGTVYRSINIISTMISQMDLQTYREDKLINNSPLINNPIDGESQRSFVQQVVHSLALWGNCFVLTYGTPVSSVDVLDPDSVTVTKDLDTGKKRYFIGPKEYKADRIHHLKFESMPGELLGHGPATGAAGELRAALMLDKFQQTWFNTDGIPRGVLTTNEKPNAQESKAMMEAWDAFLREHKNIILPLGIKYELLTAKPMELQYVDVAEANIRNIARIFGIPAANLLSSIEGSSMTYTNYIEANLQFMQNTLSNYMNAIEDFLTSLLPRTQRVRFNEEQLLRMSPEKIWTINKQKAEIGYTSGAEMREQEGLPPLPQPVVSPKTLNKDNSNEDTTQDNG